MESILKSIKAKKIPINPAVVISNNSNAKGLAIAKKLGVNVEVIESKNFKGNRTEYDEKIELSQIGRYFCGGIINHAKAIVRISSPLIADHWKKREMEKMKELYTQVSSVALVIGLGSFLLIWSNIDFLFSFLKPEFKAGIWVFFFLMIGRLTDMYFGLNGAIFTTSKKYKYDMIFTLFLIGTVYGLNLLFIPAYGISGAAISTSIALSATGLILA